MHVSINVNKFQSWLQCLPQSFSFSTGPANPNPPVGLAALNVEHSATTIVWVVTEIAYTNESYVVRYGTDVNNLTNSTDLVEGGTDLMATDQEFETSIEGLRSDTEYYFVVDSINIEGQTSSLPGSFTTLESCECVDKQCVWFIYRNRYRSF